MSYHCSSIRVCKLCGQYFMQYNHEEISSILRTESDTPFLDGLLKKNILPLKYRPTAKTRYINQNAIQKAESFIKTINRVNAMKEKRIMGSNGQENKTVEKSSNEAGTALAIDKKKDTGAAIQKPENDKNAVNTIKPAHTIKNQKHDLDLWRTKQVSARANADVIIDNPYDWDEKLVRRCETCREMKRGDCAGLGNALTCKDYDPIPNITRAEKYNWPTQGAALDIKFGKKGNS